MGTFVQTQVKLYVDGYDFSGDMNAIAMAYGAEAKDATTYGQDTRIHKGGLKTVSLAEAGLWDGSATKDKIWFDNIGSNGKPVSVMPTTGAEGERAFFFNSLKSQYTPEMPLGELMKFGVTAQTRSDLVQGTVLFPLTTAGSTDVGTALNLGAVSATQSLYAAVHVMAVSGTNPTLDVTIESDTAEGFPSTATKLTFTQNTAIGSEFKSVGPAAITDTWWRISYTIGGTNTPSFQFAVVMGIQ